MRCLLAPLFSGFPVGRLPESHTRTTTILVNKFDAGNFQRTPNGKVVGSRHGRLTIS
jgi:hypothetical protein